MAGWRWSRLRIVYGTILLASGTLLASACGQETTRASSASAAEPISGLAVHHAELVDDEGHPVVLRGFNTSGTEYACVEGWGIFDLPGGAPEEVPEAVVERMSRWRGANTVRVPLNEQCWLGLGVHPGFGGTAYQRAIEGYVQLLRRHGFVVVLDLHRSAPADGRSLEQEQMPDRDHSPEFWRQVATSFRGDTGVVFDLFNEPWPFGEADSRRAWECWRDGGCTLTSQNTGQPYTAAGMDELIAAVRSTGATNVLAVGGIHWAEVLDRWLEYRPRDPMDQLVASFHGYAFNRICADVRCYDDVLAGLADRVPLYAGEIGADGAVVAGETCRPDAVGRRGFSERLLSWLDRHAASWTVWTWNAWGDCLSLVADDAGAPTGWGREVRAALAEGSHD
ncbi:glycoside hydrolase family 5 protein [Petropleomorpha daqingensis]|uniref:Glycoside hydrolase family 5 domain-containing protein n=1 Tax=Petropleomorpha daqingensis TaxID=2026353 RepID=A0A853CDA5_9ACTN|nr:cellulase family glycosylhydrolase [Petropleomorpha daqingensis]NYJ05840.1 hypothetical protein [Petropleomorpha daqingensis]